ncbi:hypothetical protein LIER_35782 [Lithospermum erythrorhizon]|uniref:Uncharacterized protein n=1 Tax=Lithospermum erythrorhizon TaxID=34254 RepID=A0AAV3NXK1_LITER
MANREEGHQLVKEGGLKHHGGDFVGAVDRRVTKVSKKISEGAGNEDEAGGTNVVQAENEREMGSTAQGA